jgi:ribulose-5-phosphate 4-epimerase/fuculose-1-phosphate aldolase
MKLNVESPSVASADPRLVNDLVAANRILFAEGVLDGFGHVSVRHDLHQQHFLLSRSVAPALVTESDILCFGLDGEVLDGFGKQLYVERFIHSEIYARYPNIKAVVHSHSQAVIPFGSTTLALRPMFHMSAFLGAGVPVFEIRETGGDGTDILIRSRELGSALAAKLEGSSVILMRGHGNVVTGRTVRQAVFRAIYTQVNARLQLDALRLANGQVTYLNEREAAAASASVDGSDTAVDRAWDLWRARALGTGNTSLG